MSVKISAISSEFIWRRVHSLMGLWLVLYLTQHLIVNSQAALWIGDDGNGFVRLVNSLESLPYLQVVETVFIAIPLAIHAAWGIRRFFSARFNSLPYGRNRAFTWQRLTSWILLFGIAAHVLHMRFWEAPKKVKMDGKEHYAVRLENDEGLSSLAARLGVVLYKGESSPIGLLKPGQIAAVAPTPGMAMLLMVREAFKSPFLGALYTIFVLAAAYHALNGLWTSLITWGVLLSYRSQRAMLPVSVLGALLLAFLGLAAIWGSYWINLRS